MAVRGVTRRRVLIVLAVLTVMIAAVVIVVRVLEPPARRAPTGTPVTTSTPISATPTSQTAAVGPPPLGFPDMEGFTDVSADHIVDNHGIYPLATFTSPTGLQCALWSSRGDTATYCFGEISGLDHAANQVYANDYKAYFAQNAPPSADKLNGKPLASGQKVILGAGGTLMGGDQITCGVENLVVACIVVREFRRNHGDDTAARRGFVLDPQRSWTF